jgi:enoyl-CoA hydratase
MVSETLAGSEHVQYEVDDRIAVITLDRPQAANAQSLAVLEALDAAWQRADRDDDVRVIVFRSTGKHFSAGHDMTEGADDPDRVDEPPDRYYDEETRGYLHYALSWRDVPKPSIAAVQGKCIAAGLMLCWPCDLIVAADDASFSDPVVLMGIPGVEYGGHAWEVGPRKAKELLFTGASITAEEARTLGMVNRVVPRDRLVEETMAMARQIATMDPFAVRLAKRAVNQVQESQGFTAAINAHFDMHHLGHIRALVATRGITNVLVDLDEMKAHGR